MDPCPTMSQLSRQLIHQGTHISHYRIKYPGISENEILNCTLVLIESKISLLLEITIFVTHKISCEFPFNFLSV